MALLEEVLEAHGGAERWARARAASAPGSTPAACCCETRARQLRGGAVLEIGDRRALGHRRSPTPSRGARRLRPRRRADRDERRRGARVAARPATDVLRAHRRLRRNLRWDDARRGLLRRLCLVELPQRALPADPGGTCGSRGRALARGAARPGAGSRPSSPRTSTPTARARPSTTTASCAPAPPRLHGRGGRRLGTRRPHVRRPRRGRRAWCSRPGAGCVPRGPGNRPLPFPTLVSLHLSEIEVRMNGSQARPLAHPRLALQREGPLGARPQGGRARAPRAAAGRPHGDRAVADPRAAQDLPGAAARRSQRSATRPRSSRRSRRAGPTRRSIPRIPPSAAARSSSRTSSTSSSDRRSGCSAGTSCARTPSGWPTSPRP